MRFRKWSGRKWHSENNVYCIEQQPDGGYYVHCLVDPNAGGPERPEGPYSDLKTAKKAIRDFSAALQAYRDEKRRKVENGDFSDIPAEINGKKNMMRRLAEQKYQRFARRKYLEDTGFLPGR